MVWMSPTGEKSLQVHGKCVRKMFLKATPDSEVEVIEDLPEIRKLLHSWQERIIRPEYVLMAPVEEGDVQMWDNWVSCFRSK
jgi:alpha-ketoglutarate-dependent taurine dioxygenase